MARPILHRRKHSPRKWRATYASLSKRAPREGVPGRVKRFFGKLLLSAREITLLPATLLVLLFGILFLFIFTAAIRWYITGIWSWRPPAAAAPPNALETLKFSASVVAGLGGVVALTITFRKQIEQEARRNALRFDGAAEQLGNDDAAVRLAGVFAAASLADESKLLRPAVVQLLCAYLRLNREGDAAVQQTILEVIGEHTAHSAGSTSWSPYEFDLHGVIFNESLEWSGCIFRGLVNFTEATFEKNVHLVSTEFYKDVYLSKTKFKEGCVLIRAQFGETVLMNNAVFEKGINAIRSFFEKGLQANGVQCSQGFAFSESQFLNGAIFARSTIEGAYFDGCHFSRGIPGQQSSSVHLGKASFQGAKLSGATFQGAFFSTIADFTDTSFLGDYDFTGAEFKESPLSLRADFPNGRPPELVTLSDPKE